MRKGPPAAAAFSTREQALDAAVRIVARDEMAWDELRWHGHHDHYPQSRAGDRIDRCVYCQPHLAAIRREFARLTEEMGQ